MDFQTLDFLVPLLTLILLEVILGIDNIIFISILADKLPDNQRDKLRIYGLGLAVLMRMILLFAISWIMKLNTPLFSIGNFVFSGKEIILILGGVFLLYKSIKEIYHQSEQTSVESKETKVYSFSTLLLQVIAIDLVFSVDSIITAVGMTDNLLVMYTAVIISMGLMLIASKTIMNFIRLHPSFKILALAFLVVIGVTLIAEGFNYKIPKPFIYCSLAFALLVDILQIRVNRKVK